MKRRKAPRLRRWVWRDQLYDVTFVLLHGDEQQATHALARMFGDDIRGNVGKFMGGKTIWIDTDRGSAVALWFPPWFNATDTMFLSVLAHECFHAAEFVMRARAMPLHDANDEAYAYYLAWVFREARGRLLLPVK